MALITCTDCNREVSDRALACPGCGAPIAATASPALSVRVERPAKSRGTYVILAILFGSIGIHNFYAGQFVAGGIKCGLVLLAFIIDATTGFYSAFSLALAAVFWLWAIGEAIFSTEDGTGAPMT